VRASAMHFTLLRTNSSCLKICASSLALHSLAFPAVPSVLHARVSREVSSLCEPLAASILQRSPSSQE
jgi:hypothetical protein